MAEAEVNGVRLYYELHGSGEPLALVHGAWVDATAWRFVVPGLAQNCRVLSYDRRGPSRSERPATQGSFDEDGDDLAALLEALDLAPAHVVTNSGGGNIALRLATRRPDVFRSLSCHEPALWGLLEQDPECQEILQQGARSLEAVGSRIAQGDHEGAGASVNGAFEDELLTDAYVDGQLTTGPYGWINTYASNPRPIAGIETPALTVRAVVQVTDEEFTSVDFDKPSTKDYLAGDMGDELSALASLALHRRLRSGGLTRRFEILDHPGIPFKPFHRIPRIGAPSPGRPSMLPGIVIQVDPATAGSLLEKYPRASMNNARALARAARLFARALWIADDDPAQAWVRLVSAVESAAAQWKSEGGSPLEALTLLLSSRSDGLHLRSGCSSGAGVCGSAGSRPHPVG